MATAKEKTKTNTKAKEKTQVKVTKTPVAKEEIADIVEETAKEEIVAVNEEPVKLNTDKEEVVTPVTEPVEDVKVETPDTTESIEVVAVTESKVETPMVELIETNNTPEIHPLKQTSPKRVRFDRAANKGKKINVQFGDWNGTSVW